MTPRVTVILATYNWSSVLRYSIASALRQTFRDFELLVVGDGCTDDSADVAAFDDPRVRWINLPKNTRYQSGPNNEGLRQAGGELIAYLGHDDLWLSHHLRLLVDAIDGTASSAPADVAHGMMVCVGPEGQFLRPLIPRPELYYTAPPSALMHRRSVTSESGGWRDYRELTIAPDAELFRRARTAGYRFAYVPRLTGIKFPAAWRPRVYVQRPCHEQAAWLRRMNDEPDFETRVLVEAINSDETPATLPYRRLFRLFVRETMTRIRQRLTSPRTGYPSVDQVRRFKGL
jgi:glycosyltransferase involved in cell wall biosynthesis